MRSWNSKEADIDVKIDAYTYLKLGSSNEWNIKASLYSSAEFLKPKDQRYKKEAQKAGFLNHEKKGEERWRSLEWE